MGVAGKASWRSNKEHFSENSGAFGAHQPQTMPSSLVIFCPKKSSGETMQAKGFLLQCFLYFCSQVNVPYQQRNCKVLQLSHWKSIQMGYGHVGTCCPLMTALLNCSGEFLTMHWRARKLEIVMPGKQSTEICTKDTDTHNRKWMEWTCNESNILPKVLTQRCSRN